MPTVISGSTGIDKVQSGSVEQADLAANVAGNGPAMMSYATSAQSIPNGAVTLVTFGTEEYDTNSNFAGSTFTPTVAGFYQISYGVRMASAPSDLQVVLNKNGVGHRFIARTSTTLVSASTLEYANGTDTFTVSAFQSSGAAINTTAGRDTFFSAVLVRAA